MTEDRKKERKGFTLAELLIVVAIIGVLVAISIPILNAQLEKSREAHDIYTMRAVAAIAVDYYYQGADTPKGAAALGLKFWNEGEAYANASGVYDPTTGTFVPERGDVKKAYGKGTKLDTGAKYEMGSNPNGPYKNNEDYTKAVCMISIYPNQKYINVYWKEKEGQGNDKFIGGNIENSPKYSLRLPID